MPEIFKARPLWLHEFLVDQLKRTPAADAEELHGLLTAYEGWRS